MLDQQAAGEALARALPARFIDSVDGFNVVAEIPGTDPALKSEVVMLGGHLDSWHSGTGATDNGAGVRRGAGGHADPQDDRRAAAADDPRRPVDRRRAGLLRIGRATSNATSATLKTVALKPEHAKLSAYFNLDNGSGRIRGVNLQGNEAVRPIFDAWLRPFHYLGATTLTTLNTGGTDHMPFDAVGLPGFPVHPGSAELRVARRTTRTWISTRRRCPTI